MMVTKQTDGSGDMQGIDSEAHWDQALAALEDDDVNKARDQIERGRRQARRLKDYSIRWIADLLSFVGEELGEPAVEEALRRFGDRNLSDVRHGDADWWDVPAEVRAKAITRAMLANFGEVEVDQDDEKITLTFRCGSGGWLIDSGAYEGEEALLTLNESGPRTFSRDELPVYCAHCSVNNEMQAAERDGHLTIVEHPPQQPGEPCVHHIYRERDDVPEEAYVRIGRAKPSRDQET